MYDYLEGLSYIVFRKLGDHTQFSVNWVIVSIQGPEAQYLELTVQGTLSVSRCTGVHIFFCPRGIRQYTSYIPAICCPTHQHSKICPTYFAQRNSSSMISFQHIIHINCSLHFWYKVCTKNSATYFIPISPIWLSSLLYWGGALI